jgi:hypothetical protein
MTVKRKKTKDTEMIPCGVCGKGIPLTLSEFRQRTLKTKLPFLTCSRRCAGRVPKGYREQLHQKKELKGD